MPIAARRIAAKPVAGRLVLEPAAPGEATASASLVPDDEAPEPLPPPPPPPEERTLIVPDWAWPWTVQK